MRELTFDEANNVCGGIVALYWVGVGAVWAYRSYKTVRFVSQAMAGDALYGGAKSMIP
ncbi:hypothetical protein HHX48_10850 [Salinimonas sp. HHU 13199]|uniref:Class IIb bacteriocin, lactobin A/cerein 7B family n=1 Tax=Salinimonas profundi TaxID=2729140 RepID=A0ABR8LKZ4_9ALTE|nr:hypothetical protein [Salinimonas profundi]MBD3586238.1 hypothetical protein [Salinimonas profundi]